MTSVSLDSQAIMVPIVREGDLYGPALNWTRSLAFMGLKSLGEVEMSLKYVVLKYATNSPNQAKN